MDVSLFHFSMENDCPPKLDKIRSKRKEVPHLDDLFSIGPPLKKERPFCFTGSIYFLFLSAMAWM